MANIQAASKHILLLEPDAMLRHVVAMTARTLDVGQVHEAASEASAVRLLSEKKFHAAILAVSFKQSDPRAYDLSLLDSVRTGATVSDTALPVAVMVEQCDVDRLAQLQSRAVSRVIIKPFRVRVLLDAISYLSRSDDVMPESRERENEPTEPLPPFRAEH